MPFFHVKLVIRQLLLRETRGRHAIFHQSLRFSEVLLGLGRQLVTDVSGQPIGPIFKGQAVQEQPR